MFKQEIYNIKGLFRGLAVVRATGALNDFKLSDAAILLRNSYKYRGTVTGSLETTATRFPERIAIVDDDGEITYQELRNLARMTAEALASHGIDENSRVGIMARNGRGAVVPILAKGYIGYMALLLNVGASGKQVHDLIREHKLDVLFIDSEFDDKLPADMTGTLVVHADAAPGYRTDIDFPTIQDLWARPGPYSRAFPRRPKQGGIVLFSSGTSGTPKAILCPEPKNWFGVYGAATKAYRVPAGAVAQLTGGIFHTIGWGSLFLGMIAGLTIVMMRVFDPRKVLLQVEQYKCSGIQSSAMFLKAMLEADDGTIDTSSLRFIANSGNAMSPELVRGLQARYGNILLSCYGSTENFIVAVADRDDLLEDPSTAGEPVWNGRVAVLDPETGEEVPAGQEGIIHARTNVTMRGYLGDKHKPVLRQGLIDMGDRGVVDPKTGRLRVLGRSNEMIIVGGENIYPSAVANVIDLLPGVKESYCVGVDDEQTFQRVKAFVVSDGSVTADQVRDHVKATYIQWAIPRDVVFLDRPLPRNPTGKVVKDQLIALAESLAANENSAPAADPEVASFGAAGTR